MARTIKTVIFEPQAVYVLILLTCMIVWRKVGVWVLGRARMKRIQVSEYAVLYLFFLWLLGT